MKKALATLLVLAPLVGQTQAALVANGEFNVFKPGTGYTVTATLDGAGIFDSYAQGVGDARPLAGPVATATWGDASGTSAVGGPVDLPGWVSVNGSNPDTGKNGVGGSAGLNTFAGWGGQQRVETAAAVGLVDLTKVYVITAQVDGYDGNAVDGDLSFHLLANGVQLTPSALIDLPTGTSSADGPFNFEQISRTYDATSLAGLAGGEDLTIVLGAADTNTNGGRIVWDNITLDVVPEPSSALLLGLGGLALLRRRRK